MCVLSFNDRFDLNWRQAFSLFSNDVYIASKLIVRNVTKSKFKLSVFQMKYKEYLCVHDCTMHYDINIHIYMCI